MEYAYFDDLNREYVIKRPDTPMPWINYLGNEDFFGLISNTLGGYSFYRDARLQRLTRFRYNNVPADSGGRYYYIKEGDKTAWNPGFLPTKTPLDEYECRHGLGYSRVTGEKDMLSAELTCFVPIGENCEIHKLRLRNKSDETKKLQLFSFIEWCLWDAVDDNQNFQRNLSIAEVEVENGVIYHKTEYRERRRHYAYFSVNKEITGFDTDRDTFLGSMRGFDNPQVVEEMHSRNSMAHGWFPIGSHHLDISIDAGQYEDFIFILGYAENDNSDKWTDKNIINKDKARRVIAKYASPEAVDEEFTRLKAYWNQLLASFHLGSGNEKLDRMVNIWHQYQCMTTFNLSRSASYFESGTGRGMGFRDSCQDILGFVHLAPKKARRRILDLASIQLEDGSTYHQYQPLTRLGNDNIGSGFNDDPLWLIACTAAYIKETGDSAILQELVSFNSQPDNKAPLFEHLRRSVNFTLNHLGPHGLPLIGRADWNDCLNLNSFSSEPGESFQNVSTSESGVAESIFIAGMFVLYASEYAELCKRFGDAGEAAEIKTHVTSMTKTIYKYGWDGEWFLRAYDARGNKVGSKTCDEGKIYIEPQGFCVMAGLGLQNGYAEKALDSVRKHLLCDYGIELLTPCYSEYHEELGEISSYPPGYKENGSVFCHNNPWVSIAETKIGRGDKAFDYYKRICPAYLEEKSTIHKTEPYVYSQTIAGRASASYGEAKNSWLTGTAAWSFVSISQAILGIKADYDGLRIDPCLPEEIKFYKVERFFRGCLYKIRVEDKDKGEIELIVDGELMDDNLIPLHTGKVCNVEVRL